ncbi:hypothetical protein JTB14_030053 [Gonioctena quinquepunctata]|nr:hypothetical protein JTB14_030053 [Gonioctena quinquepunctata]
MTTAIFGVVIPYEDNLDNDYEFLKKLSKRKDPVDFRFTKFEDMSFADHTSPDMEKLIQASQNSKKDSENDEKTNSNRTSGPANNDGRLFDRIDDLMTKIENIGNVLNGMQNEITKLVENKTQISVQRILHDRQTIGVTYDPICAVSEYDNSIPRDCREVQDRGYNVSGVYKIQPKLSKKPSMVLCDMETRGGGWTHIQKRFDGSQDFDLGWREYKFGFGDLGGEFWLGLENIHLMTVVCCLGVQHPNSPFPVGAEGPFLVEDLLAFFGMLEARRMDGIGSCASTFLNFRKNPENKAGENLEGHLQLSISRSIRGACLISQRPSWVSGWILGDRGQALE